MNTFHVEIKDNNLIIRHVYEEVGDEDVVSIEIDELQYGNKYTSSLLLHEDAHKNKIWFLESRKREEEQQDEILTENPVIVVWSDTKKIYYGYMEKTKFYKGILKFYHKVLRTHLSSKSLSLDLVAYFQNPYNLKLEDKKFYIDEFNNVELPIKESKRKLSKKSLLKNIHHVKLPLEPVLSDNTMVNNTLDVVVWVDGLMLEYRIQKKEKRIQNTRLYLAPYKGVYIKDFAVHLRRTQRGSFTIVKRPKDPIENNLFFRIMESRPVSYVMYKLGKMMSKHSKTKVNLFYEKYSEKAEEGTFELFLMAREHHSSRCYFIIDANTGDYQRIKDEKNVVKKYSFKYYWLIYRVNNYIATEAPAHLNIIRSNNKYFRQAICEHPFMFLQHGIIYMKSLGQNCVFNAGKEGEPTYMVVSSKKERNVVSDMFGIPKERLLNVGLPIFSKVEYKHINETSEDKVVIMLTWKTYEEHLLNFEASDYYKNVVAIYNILKQYIDESKIVIVPHPKVYTLLASTSLKDSLWKGQISEVLQYAKLLITDYSSVCYNSFYQGGGVIFFQPDLEYYEQTNGTLIPSEEEYIGERVFTLEKLDKVVKHIIKDGKIQLSIARTKEHEQIYSTINEHYDGKNVERIYKALVDKKVL